MPVVQSLKARNFQQLNGSTSTHLIKLWEMEENAQMSMKVVIDGQHLVNALKIQFIWLEHQSLPVRAEEAAKCAEKNVFCHRKE